MSLVEVNSNTLPGNGSNPLLYASAYNLQLWLRSREGITFSGLLRSQGTVPPPITISGASTSVQSLHIETDSVAGGTALGQATIKWQVNGGSFVSGVLTNANVVLGSTGITAHCMPGVYNTNQKWDAWASAWADQSGNGYVLLPFSINAQPIVFSNGSGGWPFVEFDGVTDVLQTFFGLAEPVTILMVAETLALDGSVRSLWDGGIIQTMWTVVQVSPNPSGIVDNNTILVPGTEISTGSARIITDVYNHTLSLLRLDRIQTGAGSLGAASPPIGGFTLGAVANGAFPLNFDAYEVIIYASVVPNAIIDRLEGGLQTDYATP